MKMTLEKPIVLLMRLVGSTSYLFCTSGRTR